MPSYTIQPIGHVINNADLTAGHHDIKKEESIITVDEPYAEGLLHIEQCAYLDIVFCFHRAEGYRLTGPIHSGETRGVFASRSPRRPNSIGVTTVKLIKKEHNRLYVQGLDAVNNTPVIDIKCCDTSVAEGGKVHASILKNNPRTALDNLIAQNDLETLLLQAGQLHGHYCPGLAMGIMAACHAMKHLQPFSDGMEDLLAVTETNNCFADGIQYITGCTLGNNSLIFHDLGKTAFTLTRRDGRGLRIISRSNSQELIRDAFPEFEKYYRIVVAEQNHEPGLTAKYKKVSVDRAFGTLKLPFNKMFHVHPTETTIPGYAKIDESVTCHTCRESVMQSRTVKRDGRHYCLPCAEQEHNMLDGNGIHKNLPCSTTSDT